MAEHHSAGARVAERHEPPRAHSVDHWRDRAILSAAVLVLAAAAIGVVAGRQIDDIPTGFDSPVVVAMAASACLVGLIASGFMAVTRYRVGRDAISLLLGIGVLILAVGVVGHGLVYPLADGVSIGSTGDGVRAIVTGAGYGATVLFAATVFGAHRRAPIDVGRWLPVALVALVVGAAAAALALEKNSFADAADDLVLPTGDRVLAVPVIVAFLVTGAAALWPALRRRRQALAWFGLGLVALGLGEILATETSVFGDVWSIGRMGMFVVASLLVLNGVAVDLRAAFVDQQREAAHHRWERELIARRHDAEVAAHEESLHDAASSVLAIQGVSRLLDSTQGSVSLDQRRAMTIALGAEVDRLQKLIRRGQRDSVVTDFNVRDVLAPLVTVHSANCEIALDVPAALAAHGVPDDFAEIVQNLIHNARRHAKPPILVTGRWRAGDVEISVADRGQGIAEGDRERIFQRGVSRLPDGTGLGLHIARTLLEQMEGDIWVEERDGGGSRFVILMPAAETGRREHDTSLETRWETYTGKSAERPTGLKKTGILSNAARSELS